MMIRVPKFRPTCQQICQDVQQLKNSYYHEFLFDASRRGDIGLVQHMLGCDKSTIDYSKSDPASKRRVERAEERLGCGGINLNTAFGFGR